MNKLRIATRKSALALWQTEHVATRLRAAHPGIEIELLPPQDARVHFDGQARFDLRAGDCVRIMRSQHALRLLHPERYSYFAMLREKLHWSATPRHN